MFYDTGVGAHDFGGLTVHTEADLILDIRETAHGFLDTAHDELEMRDVVAFPGRRHEEVVLAIGLAVEAMAAIEHKNLERGDPKGFDQHFDFLDVAVHDRRQVIAVVHVEFAF